jgi:hypothetical protein
MLTAVLRSRSIFVRLRFQLVKNFSSDNFPILYRYLYKKKFKKFHVLKKFSCFLKIFMLVKDNNHEMVLIGYW